MKTILAYCPDHGESYPSIDADEFEGGQPVECSVCGRTGFVLCDWDYVIGEDMSYYEWSDE